MSENIINSFAKKRIQLVMADISNASIFASLISKPHDISAKAQLFIPDLEECRPDLKEYLQRFYGEVSIEVVDCPGKWLNSEVTFYWISNFQI